MIFGEVFSNYYIFVIKRFVIIIKINIFEIVKREKKKTLYFLIKIRVINNIYLYTCKKKYFIKLYTYTIYDK